MRFLPPAKALSEILKGVREQRKLKARLSNFHQAEIIENHREARKAAEAELADRRSHDAERQQEWFVTQKRAERAEVSEAEARAKIAERDVEHDAYFVSRGPRGR